jgi:hypothetical protein
MDTIPDKNAIYSFRGDGADCSIFASNNTDNTVNVKIKKYILDTRKTKYLNFMLKYYKISWIIDLILTINIKMHKARELSSFPEDINNKIAYIHSSKTISIEPSGKIILFDNRQRLNHYDNYFILKILDLNTHKSCYCINDIY